MKEEIKLKVVVVVVVVVEVVAVWTGEDAAVGLQVYLLVDVQSLLRLKQLAAHL